MIQDVYDNYVTPDHPTAFSAPKNLKNYYDRRYGTSPILETLRHIDAYTHHKEFHRPQLSNPFYVYRKRQQLQIDLFDVSGLKQNNRGVTFILLAIDSFTKYVWARQLKTKSAAHVQPALQSIVTAMGDKPESIFCDRGKEFVNRVVRDYLHEQQIKLEHPSSEKKAAIIERCNRTVQSILYRFLAHNQTRTYINNLQELIDSYNHRVHRTIKMTPTEAETNDKQQELLQTHQDRYAKIAQQRKKPRYSVGDRVLVANIAKSRFRRGYEQSFNFEQFEIVQVKTNQPVPMYVLRSLNDDTIVDGSFYGEELSVVRGDVFKVDTVLKRRRYRGRNQVFVKWRGFDHTHNQWINASELVADYREAP